MELVTDIIAKIIVAVIMLFVGAYCGGLIVDGLNHWWPMHDYATAHDIGMVVGGIALAWK